MHNDVTVNCFTRERYYTGMFLKIINKLDGCIVLNEHNTVFASNRSAPESSMQTTCRSLQPFVPGSLGDRPTDKPTDYATRSVTIGGVDCSNKYLL